MEKQLDPREGVTKFVAGRTPGWGELEFLLDGKVIDGVRMVDTLEGRAMVFARDAFGHWPALSPAGLPLLYEVRGNWTVREVYPPDTEFDDPDYVERKRVSQQRCATRRKEGDSCCP